MYNSLLVRRWQFPGKLFTLVSFDKSGGAQPTPPSGKKVMDMLMTREPGGACAVWESRGGSAVRGAGQQCVCVFVCACSQRSCRGRTTYVTSHCYYEPTDDTRVWHEGDADRPKGWMNAWRTDYLLRAAEILTRGFWTLYAARGEDQCWDVVCCLRAWSVPSDGGHRSGSGPSAEGSEGEGPCIPSSPGTEPVVLEYPVEYDPYG